MFTDQYGLPTQSNGDPNDQLQRVGMYVASVAMQEQPLMGTFLRADAWTTSLETLLQPASGVYVRYTGASTSNVSADQLIGALCAWVALRDAKQIALMLVRCLSRLGFAQNYKDGLGGPDEDSKTKVPDFMALRALPLFARMHVSLYLVTVLCDFLLICQALAAVGPVWKDGKLIPSKRGPDDVDDNNTTLTLMVCLEVRPTPLSWLAWKLFKRYRPWNLGCAEQRTDKTGLVYIDNNAYHPVIGALKWYHRAEAGGNPEVGEALIQVVRRHL
jgi:hypothetical protein